MQRVTHWLRTNAAARMPRRVVTFDSEASIDFDGARQEQRFALAVAAFDELGPDARPLHEPVGLTTLDPLELWAAIGDFTRPSHRTVVFAHNLSYDLRLTRALELLPELGFEVRQTTLSDSGCWVYLSRKGRSLYLVDSLSYLPGALDRLAKALSRRRPRLPPPDADLAELERRCRADVRVLREAVLWLLSALHDEDLGDFRTTGAGQASAAFRHRFLEPHTLLVHDRVEQTERERVACWAGRAEVWRHGKLRGPLFEYDYQNAYARIALERELPVRARGEWFPAGWQLYDQLAPAHRLLAEVEVETAKPVLPALVDERIVWPVGRFTTTVWDTELELARDEGCRLRIRRLWPYHKAPLLHDWAVWILAGLDGDHIGAHPLGRLVLKHWSRALIGRFGLRYPLLERLGELPTSDVRLYPVFDAIEDRTWSALQVGRVEYEITERVEAPSSTPFVLGYVMAECRRRLWQAMRAAGLDNVYSVDTDGLIVGEAGQQRLEAAIAAGELDGLRLKARYKRAELRGPRNLDLDNERRVSGVPRRAEQLEPGKFRGEVWESLPTALRYRRSSSVIVYERNFTVSALDPRRLHLDDGWTDAHVVGGPGWWSPAGAEFSAAAGAA